jgi:hypothetical protein
MAMTRVVTQSILALSTLIIPIALIAGMLSFPSTCQCGAVLPHDHSLFMLAGHSHLSGAHHHDHAARKASASYDGPTFQLPAANASAQNEGAVLAPSVLTINSDRPFFAAVKPQPLPSQAEAPELPPPRA